MNAQEFAAKCYGKASMDIPEAALDFAIRYYKALDLPFYCDKNLANCLRLARTFAEETTIIDEGRRLLKEIETLKPLLIQTCEIKESLRMASTDLRKITTAAGLATTGRRGKSMKESEA
jgi:hypothetical protein